MLYKLTTQPSKENPEEPITIYVNTNEVSVIVFKPKNCAEVYIKDSTDASYYVVTHQEANDLIKYTNGLGHYN
jgi:hypothetical protein